MRKLLFCSIIILLLLNHTGLAQVSKEDLKKGINLIETKVYSAEEDSKILSMYQGLRVADVSDGMDMVGLPNTGLVDHSIHPDWVDHDDLSHVFRGIAITARYIPTQRPNRPEPGEDFKKWEGNFYNSYSNEAFTELIKPGTAIVLDDVEEMDIGSIGSYNILATFSILFVLFTVFLM